ncbi:putative ubiquitinyl hydrolase 1 [Helianthus annuus]|nr:putative ubiquitinyl hydrolase 1 [Helianthus annuus]KAJ0782412.1 putative ubiquitinyl hydrolase 1 [Helianthus annuus]KAJ0956019.1 putative ubiquitinyl hydrolase 1 [Helianthus annuus]
MLHTKETDLPGLFLVFVVLPIIAYILLGKWSEVAKKKDKIRVLAQIAAQESFRAKAMLAAVDINC